MYELFDVKSKIVLITGSTSGLGLKFAQGMAKSGAKVIINGRSGEKLEKTAQEFKKNSQEVYPYAFDVGKPETVQPAIDKIEQEVGPIDILVNNAGVNLRGPLEDYDNKDWDTVIGINLSGAYHVGKAVAKYMIGRKRGKIINICSMQSELGRPEITAYAASKGGVKMLTKGMAVEWAKHNIQVNGIGPGYFKTELTKPLYENEEFDRWLCSRTPAARWGNTEELIGALLFLSSNASSYVNGHILYVDGGMLASV